MYELIIPLLENSTAVKVRTLAKVCGKIIAMSPALGYATQVMTRCIFSVLNLKDDWNQIININYHNDCIRELVFWKLNIFDFKPTSLLEKSYNCDIDSGAAGFIQNTTFVMHKSWSEVEAVKSSTWRELKAIALSLFSFLHVLRNSTITFYSNSQNATDDSIIYF